MKPIQKILLLLSCFIAGRAAAQAPQNWPTTNYTPTAYDKTKALRILVIPTDTLMLNIADSGAIAYKNGNQYVWTGHLWKLSSGGGGSADSGILATNFRVDTAKAAIRASVKDISDQLGGYFPFPAGTSAQYVKGDGNLATMDTTVIPSFSFKVRSLIRQIDITNALTYTPLRPLDTANLKYRIDTIGSKSFRFANATVGTKLLRSIDDSTAQVKTIQLTRGTVTDRDSTIVLDIPTGTSNVPAVQMRNEKKVKLSLPIRYEGNSITASAGATDTVHGYPALLYAQYGVSYVNTAVSNSSVRDVISRQFSNAAATKVSTSLSIMMGTNNLRQDPLGTKQPAVREALRVIIANQFVDSIWAISNAKFTKNGSWSNFTASNLTSKSVAKSLGNPMKSSTAGNTLTFLWTDDNMIIGTYAWQGYHNLGRFSVTVDGINKGTYSGRDLCSDHQSNIGTYDYRQPIVFIFTGLGAGTHAVTITLLDNAETDFDYVAKFMTVDNCSSALVAHITKCTPAGYVAYGDTNSSDAVTDTANANIDTVVNYFRTLGFPVATVPTENFLNITTSGTGDGLHPGNVGYAQLAKAWASVIDFPNSGGASQLAALTDVAISTPQENDILTRNGTGKWGNTPGLVANLSAPEDGDILVRDAGIFVNRPALIANITSPADGDLLIKLGAAWVNKPSVNIDLTGIAVNDIPIWNGSKFVKYTPTWGGGGGSYTFPNSVRQVAGVVDLIGDSSSLVDYRVYASQNGVRTWYKATKMSLTSPTDGDILFYRASDTTWVNHPITGDFTISTAGVGAIGSGKVTNGMLAGSIAASKLVGTDITAVGTITTGTWNATAISTSKGGVPTGGTAGQVLTKNTSSNYDYAWAPPSSGFADPMTTIGDIIIRNASNVTARLAGNTSTALQVLSSIGSGSAATAPTWRAITKSDLNLGNVENTALSTWPGSANIVTVGTIATGSWNATAIPISKGGTGLTAVLNGMVKGNGMNYSAATAGTDYYAPGSTDVAVGDGGTGISSYTLGDLLYASGTTALSKLAGNTTTTKKFLNQAGTGSVSAAPAWAAITDADVAFSDVTTGNASTSAHGYMKKLPGDATLVYGGDGNFSTVVTSSTYTPTISNLTNCTASGNLSHWLRIGNEVTVWGTINPLATSIGECYLEISLPVASNLTNSLDCVGGSNIENNGPFTGGGITANNTTDMARLHFTAPSTTSSTTLNYSFTYTIK